jgi:hypothetical protein
MPAHPSGPANPLHQQIGRFGQLKIDHLIHMRHVEPPRRDIGRQENQHPVASKLFHHPITRVLGEISLQRGHRIAGL